MFYLEVLELLELINVLTHQVDAPYLELIVYSLYRLFGVVPSSFLFQHHLSFELFTWLTEHVNFASVSVIRFHAVKL